MNEFLLPSLAIIAGLAGLVWGADRFVAGSAAAAKNFGISPLIIGLTIVSIGTSAPEIIVAVDASLRGTGDLAVGNALGSNLANIGLVLGVTALISPLPTQRHLLAQETPALLGITLVAGALLFDNYLGRADGWILLLLLVPLLWTTLYFKKKNLTPIEIVEEEEIPDLSNRAAIIWFVIGLGILLVSSDALVWGATEVATALGVSPLIIGLTVIAVGTSLPELAASVMSAVKGHHDLALGNIIGSNMFNLMAVLSMPGIISPMALDAEVFARDYMSMAAFTLVLPIAIWLSLRGKNAGQSGRLGRRFGALLLAMYAAYYWNLF